jgi:hypothetical protein
MAAPYIYTGPDEAQDESIPDGGYIPRNPGNPYGDSDAWSQKLQGSIGEQFFSPDYVKSTVRQRMDTDLPYILRKSFGISSAADAQYLTPDKKAALQKVLSTLESQHTAQAVAEQKAAITRYQSGVKGIAGAGKAYDTATYQANKAAGSEQNARVKSARSEADKLASMYLSNLPQDDSGNKLINGRIATPEMMQDLYLKQRGIKFNAAMGIVPQEDKFNSDIQGLRRIAYSNPTWSISKMNQVVSAAFPNEEERAKAWEAISPEIAAEPSKDLNYPMHYTDPKMEELLTPQQRRESKAALNKYAEGKKGKSGTWSEFVEDYVPTSLQKGAAIPFVAGHKYVMEPAARAARGAIESLAKDYSETNAETRRKWKASQARPIQEAAITKIKDIAGRMGSTAWKDVTAPFRGLSNLYDYIAQ